MAKCKNCKRGFPDHLVSQMAIAEKGSLKYLRVCPICALEIGNRLSNTPKRENFTEGSQAQAMLQEARAIVAQRKGTLASRQPMDGDIIIHCGHLTPPHHFAAPPPGAVLSFLRPDGSEGEAKFIVACDECFQANGKKMDGIAINAEGTWVGDKPVIYVPGSN